MDFIEVFDDALPAADCRRLIERFEASGEAARGRAGLSVDTRLKDSWDIPLSGRPDWADAVQMLNAAMLRGLLSYVRRYPFAALAPFRTDMTDAAGERVPVSAETVPAMSDVALGKVVTRLFRPGTINLQKYLAGEGGYPHWHCEVYPTPKNNEALHRTLLWTLYLNDDFGEGETEFFHQQRKIAPRTGSLLFAPAAFTHTHRGNRPQGGAKYIATSWVLLQRADVLYGAPAGPASGS